LYEYRLFPFEVDGENKNRLELGGDIEEDEKGLSFSSLDPNNDCFRGGVIYKSKQIKRKD